MHHPSSAARPHGPLASRAPELPSPRTPGSRVALRASAGLLLLAGLGQAQAPPQPYDGQNVLVLLADDIGIDSIPSYAVGLDLPNTPNIDQLAETGVRFLNAWSYPICSATRATPWNQIGVSSAHWRTSSVDLP